MGSDHEYYVTASYAGKIQGASQVNVDVANPDHRPKSPQKPQTTPKKPSPNGAVFSGTSSKAPKQDTEQKITHAYFVDLKGNPVKRIKVGDSVRIRIKTVNMIGENLQFIVKEYDLLSENDKIAWNNSMKIIADAVDTPVITITPERYDGGIDNKILYDYDKVEQQYFIEIIPLGSKAKSKKFGLDDEAKRMKVENGKSPAKVEKTDDKKTPATCICKEQYKDLIWGGKVSCDFRKKVVEICEELWKGRGLEMANQLMACMALESMQSFSSSIGYPNATGLVQFTSGKYGAITAMNETGYNGGKTITKDYLKDLTSVEQLKYVKLYFQMWIEKYKKNIKDSLDMYMTIWCPAAVGKDDTFVCYSAERDKKNNNTFYDKNKSAEYEYYDENEKKVIDRLKKDAGRANGEITKGELRPRLKYWKELGELNKAKINTCMALSSAAVKPVPSRSKIVFFDEGITQDRKIIVSQKTIEILEKAAVDSSNDKIIITSTIRSTRRQAEAMYANESTGNHIRYAAPGRKVIEVFNKGRRNGNSKEKIIADMDSKIKELSNIGQRVSKHCVSDEVYKYNNILDISYSRGIKNPRDFIKELNKNASVTKILHPLNNVVAGSKIFYDTGEKAIHIEVQN